MGRLSGWVILEMRFEQREGVVRVDCRERCLGQRNHMSEGPEQKQPSLWGR